MTSVKRFPMILLVAFIFIVRVASANEREVNKTLIHSLYNVAYLLLMNVLQDCTDIARDDVPLLVFSTLGGGLTAVDPITSEIRWSIDDGAYRASENCVVFFLN